MTTDYLAQLDSRYKLLWSAFIWYVTLISRHATFAPEPWFNAAGIAVVVGLVLAANAIPPGQTWRSLGCWPLIRYFLIPFCVSSFSAIMSDVELVVIFPRNLADNLIAGGSVVGFLILCAVARSRQRRAT